MRFGALGDIHGDFASVRRVMSAHPDVPFWLCVGDVATAEGRYEPFPSPLYWIKGNNENFDAIADAQCAAAPCEILHNLFFIPNGHVIDLGASSRGTPLRIAGLGGTFAPTMYDTRAADLPHPKKGSAKATELADRRRHFVREEVDACKQIRHVDVLLTHEAPRPFRVGRADAGKTAINEVLAAMKPRLHLFGHHHRFQDSTVSGVRSVCLDAVGRSHLLVDLETLEFTVVM
jgi:predicted phosphodiesterase